MNRTCHYIIVDSQENTPSRLQFESKTTLKKNYFSGVHHKKKDCATSLVMNKEQNKKKLKPN